MKRWISLVLLAFSLPSCQKFDPADFLVDLKLPEQFSLNPEQFEGSLKKMAGWWQRFEEGPIGELIQLALENNHDITDAKKNIRAALLYNGMNEKDIEAYEKDPQNSPLTVKRVPDGNYKISKPSIRFAKKSKDGKEESGIIYDTDFLTASFEIDIFNRNKFYVEAQKHDILCKEGSHTDVYKMVRAQIVKLAIRYFYLKERRRINGEAIDKQKSLSTTMSDRLTVGLVKNTDHNASLTWISKLEERESRIKSDMQECIGLINRLTGGNNTTKLVGILDRIDKIPVIKDNLFVGTPFAVIKNRPDVAVKERLMKKAASELGLTMANAFPSITLESTLKSSANKIQDILKGKNILYHFGPQLLHNAYERWKPNADTHHKRAQYERAKGDYLKTVTNAVAEVSDCIASVIHCYEKKNLYADRSSREQKISKNSKANFMKDGADFVDHVEYHYQGVTSEDMSLDNESLALQFTIDLVRSLGI